MGLGFREFLGLAGSVYFRFLFVMGYSGWVGVISKP